MSRPDVTEPVLIERPRGAAIPLVLDSPHSGTWYPDDFDYVCDGELLKTAEDTHVEDLFGAGPDLGAVMVHARFPRSYIDVNRAADDIDPGMLDGSWPMPLNPGPKSGFGLGLIRNLCVPRMPVYDRKLSVAEVQGRIDGYYRPYHAALSAELDALHARFGQVWHVDCHSMQAVATDMAPDSGKTRPDFCVSDYRGTSADPAFTRFAADQLSGMGYEARINDPYFGVEIVRRYGRPAERRHSIQIEVKRSLYMDEKTRGRNAGYATVRRDLTRLLEAIKGWIAER
jgi:N-formylglutamate amidohydrolase